MTTGKPTTNVEDARLWASRLLGVSIGDEPHVKRLHLLEHLQEVDFLPAPEWDLACQILESEDAASLPPRALMAPIEQELEARVATRLAAFAADFFAIPPGERRQRWQALQRSGTSFPRIQARLHALEPGLDHPAVAPQTGNVGVALLLQQLRELFACAPRDRSLMMACALAKWQDRAAALAAVAEVRSCLPTVALYPTLLERIVALHKPGGRETGDKVRPLSVQEPPQSAWRTTLSSSRNYPLLIASVVGGLIALRMLSNEQAPPHRVDLPQFNYSKSLWVAPDWSNLPRGVVPEAGPWRSLRREPLSGESLQRQARQMESFIVEERAHAALVLNGRTLSEAANGLQEEDWHAADVRGNLARRRLDEALQARRITDLFGLFPPTDPSSAPEKP